MPGVQTWVRHNPSLLLLSLLLTFALLPAFGQHESDDLIWEYRWSENEVWTPVSSPSNPPGREGSPLLWLRTTLPDRNVRDPALFVYSIDTAAIFYVQGERVYAFPEHSEGETPEFAGWPWHIDRKSVV